MPYTDDPLMDFDRWQTDQERWLSERPQCDDCGEHIQSETAFYINDCWICEDCIDSYRREVQPEW